MLLLGDLVHFDKEGWCILSFQEHGSDGNIESLEFMTVGNFADHPRVFYTPHHSKLKRKKLMCQARFDDVEHYGDIKRGDKVFYMIADKKNGSRIYHGKVTSVNHDTQNVVIDNRLTVKLLMLLKHEHNMEQIQGTDAFICDACQALKTTAKINRNY